MDFITVSEVRTQPLNNAIAEDAMFEGTEGRGAESSRYSVGDRPRDVQSENSRMYRRQREQQLRRNRRAAISDQSRTGLQPEKHSVPSLGEMRRWHHLESTFSNPPCGTCMATATSLRRLKRGLAASDQHRQAFSEPVEVEGRFAALMSALKSDDPEIQLEAAACFTNWALVPWPNEVIHTAAPYLITLANSPNQLLQGQCIWALGNMCCSGTAVCSLLARQGLPKAALNCLKSLYSDTRDSAAQAIAAFVTHAEEPDARSLAYAVLPHLPSLINLDSSIVCLCASAVADCAVEARLSSDDGDTNQTKASAITRNEAGDVRKAGDDAIMEVDPRIVVKQDDCSMVKEAFELDGSLRSGDVENNHDHSCSSAHCGDSSTVDPELIQRLTSVVSGQLLEGLTRDPSPPLAPIGLLLRTLTSLSRLPMVVMFLLSHPDIARTLTLLLHHSVVDLRRETLPLVANLMYADISMVVKETEVEDEVDVEEIEQRRDHLRRRLSSQLEMVYSGLRNILATIILD